MDNMSGMTRGTNTGMGSMNADMNAGMGSMNVGKGGMSSMGATSADMGSVGDMSAGKGSLSRKGSMSGMGATNAGMGSTNGTITSMVATDNLAQLLQDMSVQQGRQLLQPMYHFKTVESSSSNDNLHPHITGYDRI